MLTDTKWRDTAKQPLVIEWEHLTLVDSYSFITGADCPDNDPVAFELHGSQDGSYWILLDSQVVDAPPPSMWRPAQTEWFTFKNCTPTTTATTQTRSSTTSSATQSSTTTSFTLSSTQTVTYSTTTSPEGDFVQLLSGGNCALRKLHPILAQAECEAAARQLQLPDTSAETTATANRPEGCLAM